MPTIIRCNLFNDAIIGFKNNLFTITYFTDNAMDIKLVMSGLLNYEDPNMVFELTFGVGAMTLDNPNVQAMMRNQKFDVVIAEYMFVDLYSS